MHNRSLLSSALTLLLSSPVCARPGAQFQPLGFLQPNNAGPVIAYGMSANGGVVVGQANSTSGFQAFRWTAATGMVGLGAFPNPGGFPLSGARACSADGSVIVGASDMPNSLNEDGAPFRWTQQTGLVFLGNLGGSNGGVARAVSSDGSVVVGYSSKSGPPNYDLEAFRWTAGSGMVGMGDLDGGVHNSQASAVSGDGSIAIGLASTSASPYNRSFKWTQADGIVELQPASFRAVGMSRNGQFGVGGNVGRAARLDRSDGALLMIPHVAIPGLNTDTDLAWAANADGSVVVGMQNLSQGNEFFGRAFVWDATHGTRILHDVLVNDYGLGPQLAGWELNCATAVSDNGMAFAGYGFAPSGEQAAWFAKFPQPCFADIAPSGVPSGDGVVNVDDLLAVINAWGPCADPKNCPPDIAPPGGNGTVNVDDLLAVINAWGPCP